ncbi:MAG: DUF2852 domain-containing protein [Rhodobacteraceae bacterium]|nr:DUF2852 domain-containing protein [Paracoccaceae bacterium]
MNSTTGSPRSVIAWIDGQGKLAWIAIMVIGFIVFWPVGLLVLFYLIWSKRMFNCDKSVSKVLGRRYRFRPSGNAAFDNYKEQTLQRLEDEQAAFEEFLRRLREAKDKAEFDQFLDERSRQADATS